ncbi:MAG TPA: DUF4118 domain-containing protein [Opitutaceae bacterium]|nr:DUF4118 domain-containing protein [Opitutaceae bacterium]
MRSRARPAKTPAEPSSPWTEYAVAIAAIAVVTGVGIALPPISHVAFGLIYLLTVMVVSLWIGRGPVLLAGILSALAWEYVFIPPRFAIAIDSPDDALLFITYIIVALVAGQLTGRFRSEAENERVREASEKLHRALFDSVSHELRTPLAVIDAAVDGLEDSDDAARRELTEEVRIAVRRLNRLVRNLLDQTRLEGGALRPRVDWCQVADVVNSAVDGTRDALAGHALEITIPDDLPPIRADFALTEHALMNLLLNAAFHTPPGTSVRLSAGLRGDGVFIAVADRGPGFPANVRERLFQKFTRGEAARVGGLGLGLSIVRGLVHAQGGDVAVADNPGGGALVTLSLPRTETNGK